MNLFIIIIIIIGYIAGTLVNYFSDTLPYKRKITYPICTYCTSKVKISNYINIFKSCTNCGKPRTLRTWLIVFFFITITLVLWINPPVKLGFIISLTLFCYLFIVAVIDFEHRVILHPVSLIGAVLCMIIGVWMHGIISTIIGAIVGFFIMLFLYYLGIFLVKLRSRTRKDITEREAMGFGDVNLGGVLGLLMGWPAIILCIIITILTSGVISFFYIIYMILKGQYSANLSIPYGPFMIASVIFLIFLSKNILF